MPEAVDRAIGRWLVRHLERVRLRMFDTAIIDQLSAPRAVGHFCRVSSSAMPASVVMPRARIAPKIGSIWRCRTFLSEGRETRGAEFVHGCKTEA